MADEAEDEYSESSLGERSSVNSDPDCEQDNDDDQAEVDMVAFSNDFAEYFDVNVSKQAAQLEHIIDGLLGKLEEFSAITDEIRTESKDRLFNQFPEVMRQCLQFDQLFTSINQLERFVQVVKDCVVEMEEKVSLAEKELGNKNLKKLLTTVRLPRFLAQHKQLQPYLKSDTDVAQWRAPTKMFSVADYLPQRQPLPDLIDNNAENLQRGPGMPFRDRT